MKRTPMPRRKKPMARGNTSLTQGAPLQRRTELGNGTKRLERHTPMPQSLKPLPKVNVVRQARKATAVQVPVKPNVSKLARPRDTGPSKDVKDLLRKKRAKGRCERCGGTGRLDVHHRRARKMGGTTRPEINSPENLLVLCRPCHLAITATNGRRAEYEFEGLLIREDRRDPADVKVLLAGGWFLLNHLGGKTPTTAPEAAA